MESSDRDALNWPPVGSAGHYLFYPMLIPILFAAFGAAVLVALYFEISDLWWGTAA
jgi:hypothetical protein